MTFTYDTSSARGRVRLLVGDTDTATAANQIFDDDEIDAFLALENNEPYPAAASACRSIAANTARSAVAFRGLETSLDRKDIPKHFMALAKDYMARATEPFEEIDSMAFDIGHLGHDNSEYVGDTLL